MNHELSLYESKERWIVIVILYVIIITMMIYKAAQVSLILS